MKRQLQFIGLMNHVPTEDARQLVDQWLGEDNHVSVSYSIIDEGYQFDKLHKKFRFRDLPALIIDRENGRGFDKYYRKQIEKIVICLHMETVRR